MTVRIQDKPNFAPQNCWPLTMHGAGKAMSSTNETNFVPALPHSRQVWDKKFATVVRIRAKPCPQNHWPLTMRGARKAVLPPTTSPRTRKKAAIMPAMGACSGLAVPLGAYIMARLLR